MTETSALLRVHAQVIAEALTQAPLEQRPRVTPAIIVVISESSYLLSQVLAVAARVRDGHTVFDYGAREIADLVRAHAYYPDDDELLHDRLATVEQAVADGVFSPTDGAPSRDSIRRRLRCGKNRSRHVSDAYCRLILRIAPPLTRWAANL
ncbi:hypothetical protein [Umezawaea sp. Da 62-37]|uniref:hypothetical protein n=1 Tax=Umezawaea sp. Da 62-37 TaxID=3075927 RepID=UPI0028F6F802|nr:hypothetical protein [Umezawaea sp. Da 62-37]WNV82916.1 hypothetical protein RM788_32585 [Umezawaea sp. Da 62-37]